MTPVIPSPESRPHAVFLMPAPSDHSPTNDAFARLRLDHARLLSRFSELEHAGITEPGEAFEDGPLHELAAHLGSEFAAHMATEDAEMFPPLVRALPELRGTLVQLTCEHVEVRGMLGALCTLLSQPRGSARDEQLRVLVRDLIDLIRLHVRREECVVFDLAARVLGSQGIEPPPPVRGGDPSPT